MSLVTETFEGNIYEIARKDCVIKWNRVEDKLPDMYTSCLVTVEILDDEGNVDRYSSSGYTYDIDGTWYDEIGDVERDGKVIAWAELPKPYKFK